MDTSYVHQSDSPYLNENLLYSLEIEDGIIKSSILPEKDTNGNFTGQSIENSIKKLQYSFNEKGKLSVLRLISLPSKNKISSNNLSYVKKNDTLFLKFTDFINEAVEYRYMYKVQN